MTGRLNQQEASIQSWNDLAHLWTAQSRHADAWRMLEAAYHSFTEGFETRDLKNVARILE